MGWRERMMETVPAWVAMLTAWVVLVTGWAVTGRDQEYAPWWLTFLALLLMAPVYGRAAHVRWWRAIGLIVSLFLAVAVAAQTSPFWLWLLAVVGITVPAAYWLIDRTWSPPWRSGEDGG
jgi:hypothetical protein